jgi:hypothetical protein
MSVVLGGKEKRTRPHSVYLRVVLRLHWPQGYFSSGLYLVSHCEWPEHHLLHCVWRHVSKHRQNAVLP